MSRLKILIAFIALFFNTVTYVNAQQKNEKLLSSPDGKLSVVFSANEKDYVAYAIQFMNKPVVKKSKLGLEIENDGPLGYDMKLIGVKMSQMNKTDTLITGKTKFAVNRYNEMNVALQEKSGQRRQLNIIFRAYNDGIAFRYYIPSQPKLKKFNITDELTTFNLIGDPKMHYTAYDEYTNSHETVYSSTLLSQIPTEVAVKKKSTPNLDDVEYTFVPIVPSDFWLLDMPVLVENENGIFLSITEANVRNYPGMYLVKGKGTDHVLYAALSPLIGQYKVKARIETPFETPWRTFMISDQIGKLIESDIVDNLCEPNAIGDVSWMKIGKTTWPWWNGNVAKNVDFKVGVNTAFTKHYIDFASENGIAFHAISDDDGLAWYGKSRGDSVALQDVTKPISSLDMPEIMRYAKEKGVGVRLWVHYTALKRKLDEAFATYEKWGIDGMMVDFINRDDQDMMIFMEEVLQKAAKHHLKIQFHGAPKPTGLKKTYPNLTNTESVYNLEQLKWADKCTPDHNVMVAFTRMLAGPLDYHLGGFNSVKREDFKKGSPYASNYKTRWRANALNYYEPVVVGTRSHHMALYVVYENPEPMLCDHPEAYKNQLGFEFLLKVPTVWDETKVINAKIGEYISIARKKNNEWYIGTITNWDARDLKISLNFLPEGKYAAEIYSDTFETNNDPNVICKKNLVVTANDVLDVKLCEGGGHIVHLRPL